MSNFTACEIETLLHSSEGETLDFKREQYRVVKASPEEKSEFIKDVLAFANAWKKTDAYILIGVDENRSGGRATLIGDVSPIDDADLQQLVNEKTNRAVRFDYFTTKIDGKSIGVIRIDKDQERPIWLRKKFGRLDAHVVYIRRGSSTFIADPDEISRMGATASSSPPALELGLRQEGSRANPQSNLEISSQLLVERPISDEMLIQRKDPTISSEERRVPMATIGALQSLMREDGKPPKEAVRRFLRERALFKPIEIVVTNVGSILAKDVWVTLRLSTKSWLFLRRDAPAAPRAAWPFALSPIVHPDSDIWLDLECVDDTWEVTLQLGKIQPGTYRISDSFWIGAEETRDVLASARITGDNFSPIDAELRLQFKVDHRYIDEAEEEYHKNAEDEAHQF